jgi:hypothetical protein
MAGFSYELTGWFDAIALAQILLACDEGTDGPSKTDLAITKELPVSLRTIEHLREWACEAGPINALSPRPNPRVYLRKLDGRAEARLIAMPKKIHRKVGQRGRCNCWPTAWSN